MKYVVSIARTTGKKVEEFVYADAQAARAQFKSVLRQPPCQRVLVLLSRKDRQQERILEVDFVDGLAL